MIKITKEILEEGMVDASELGMSPGVWPKVIQYDNSYLQFSGFDAYGSAIYTSLFGSLIIVNS